MENVARPPPGLGASASAWAPFDIKGIRLYPHESRYSREFSGGLHVPAHLYGALESNLARDIALLTRRGLSRPKLNVLTTSRKAYCRERELRVPA